MNDLIHRQGVMTVFRAKWALNCVLNKSATKINRQGRLGKERPAHLQGHLWPLALGSPAMLTPRAR